MDIIDFWFLILHPVTLLNSVTNSNSLPPKSDFSRYTIVVMSAFLFSDPYAFIPFSGLIVLGLKVLLAGTLSHS